MFMRHRPLRVSGSEYFRQSESGLRWRMHVRRLGRGGGLLRCYPSELAPIRCAGYGDRVACGCCEGTQNLPERGGLPGGYGRREVPERHWRDVPNVHAVEALMAVSVSRAVDLSVLTLLSGRVCVPPAMGHEECLPRGLSLGPDGWHPAPRTCPAVDELSGHPGDQFSRTAQEAAVEKEGSARTGSQPGADLDGSFSGHLLAEISHVLCWR